MGDLPIQPIDTDLLMKLLSGSGAGPAPTPMSRNKMTRDEAFLSPPPSVTAPPKPSRVATLPEPVRESMAANLPPTIKSNRAKLAEALNILNQELPGDQKVNPWRDPDAMRGEDRGTNQYDWGKLSRGGLLNVKGEIEGIYSRPRNPKPGEIFPTVSRALSPDTKDEALRLLTNIIADESLTEELSGPKSLEQIKGDQYAALLKSGAATPEERRKGFIMEPPKSQATTPTGPGSAEVEDDEMANAMRQYAEMAAGGIKTPDEADERLRFDFKDDPYLESVIQEARERHAAAQGANREAPGIGDYIGYALAMLGGANPMQAAELVGRRGEKRRNEEVALQNLLNAQNAKITDRRDQRRLFETSERQMRQIETMLGRDKTKAETRATERAQDRTFQGGKAMRSSAERGLHELNEKVRAGIKLTPQEMKDLEMFKKRINYASTEVLGEPTNDQIGMMNPLADPTIARILGMDA